jgi:hypothetical protein
MAYLSRKYLGLDTSVSAGNGMGALPPVVLPIVPGSRADG